ncbi:hypothetical protein Hanom_Chr15g01359201 [Helianthus anomalus]
MIFLQIKFNAETRSNLKQNKKVSVFLGIKNTEVRAYRTDPVQVRSCFFASPSSL